MNRLIFVSSAQKELAAERRAIADHVRTDPLLRRYFDVFLFEELSPRDRKADELYLEKVDPLLSISASSAMTTGPRTPPAFRRRRTSSSAPPRAAFHV